MSQREVPTLRADAERNRRRILEVADEVFATRGLDASIDDIAAASGVGIGTIYRRFHSKQGLVTALFQDRVDVFLPIAERIASGEDGWESLCELMRFFVESQAGSKAMQELFYESTDAAASMLRLRVEPLLRGVIERAKAEGALRDDFAPTDVPILTHAASTLGHSLRSHGPDLARRHLELLLKGIAATPDPHPIPPPLADDDFALWLGSVAR